MTAFKGRYLKYQNKEKMEKENHQLLIDIFSLRTAPLQNFFNLHFTPYFDAFCFKVL